MNPNVAEVIKKAPFSPVKHVWFDLLDQNNLRSRMEGWLKGKSITEVIPDHVAKEMPMPFDNMALLLPLGLSISPDEPSKKFLLTVDRVGDLINFQFWVGSYKTPVLDITIKNKLLDSPTKTEVNKEFARSIRETVNGSSSEVADRLRLLLAYSLPIFAAICYAPTNHLIATEGYRCKPNPSNANRLRRGKRPLFEWETVLIKSTVVENQVSLGGTHASPKPHDRRGHQRRYKSGKVVYVRSCTINKHKIKEEGFIHHDYQVVS
jgi:hypothetical protein